MTISTKLKNYYWQQGINYDKATRRLLGHDKRESTRVTLRAAPIVLDELVAQTKKEPKS